jgi:hypothetical protein
VIVCAIALEVASSTKTQKNKLDKTLIGFIGLFLFTIQAELELVAELR